MPNNKILALIADNQYKKFSNRNIIYNINDKADKIYFIMRGQVEIF
jgi:hypothetical protein